MFSAISLGVFCRLAPSTSAIIRSMKLSPGFCVILTTMRSRQHRGAAGDRGAVAAGLADHRRRFAGDRRLIHRGNAFHDVAVAGDDLAGLDHDDVALLQQRRGDLFLAAGSARVPSRRAGGPWCRSWSCAAISACALPRPSATASARLAKSTVSHSQTTISQREPGRVDDRQDGAPDGADLDDEHDRVAPQRARVELAQRVRAATSTASSGRAGRPARAFGAGGCRLRAVRRNRWWVVVISGFLQRGGRARAWAGR